MPKGDLERIFLALGKAEVRYLVVGGVAVVLYGHPRFTADLDLVVQLETSNLKAALRTLSRLGYKPRLPVKAIDFADPAKRRAWIAKKGLRVFSLWSPKAPVTGVDLFAEEPFPFGEAYRRSLQVSIGSTKIRVAALDDLIRLKRVAGRPQDWADIAALKAIRTMKKGKRRG